MRLDELVKSVYFSFLFFGAFSRSKVTVLKEFVWAMALCSSSLQVLTLKSALKQKPKGSMMGLH